MYNVSLLRTLNLRIQGPLLLWRQEQIIPQLRFWGRDVKKGRERKNELERER